MSLPCVLVVMSLVFKTVFFLVFPAENGDILIESVYTKDNPVKKTKDRSGRQQTHTCMDTHSRTHTLAHTHTQCRRVVFTVEMFYL